MRAKIDFGIDLGTTNSAMAVTNRGEVRIIKSTTQKDTTASCVSVNSKGRIHVGEFALSNFQRAIVRLSMGEGTESDVGAFIEFKRTMGTDKRYVSSHLDQAFSSEALSAEVLKELKTYFRDESISAAVVTVPALFRQNQVDATKRAAELAGLNHCVLLQEPIAASLAYGMSAEKMEGSWIVFDFGGGTFDAALMNVNEGIMQVVDTEGDNHLGGKDLDAAIVDEILIPWIEENFVVEDLLSDPVRSKRLRDALKRPAEHIKISLSSRDHEEYQSDEPVGVDDEGEDIELDLTVSLDDYESAVMPIFQKAIDLAKGLRRRNGDREVRTILLVGGPTYSQTLRSMLRDEFGDILNTSIDPMTAVAQGAALFASTQAMPDDLQARDSTKVQLTLKYAETTVETKESLGIRINRVKSEGEVPEVLTVEIARADRGWFSPKVKVTDADIIELQLVQGPNTFDITLTDERGNLLQGQPSSFTVVQGLKVARPTLPRSICIESIQSGLGMAKLARLEGLEKNHPLPAEGKGSFKTQMPIRPGNESDVLRIPILEGEPGERAAYNELAGVVKITGDEISEFLPEGSEVHLKLKVDASRLITLEAFFPAIDETVEVKVEDSQDSEQKEYDAKALVTEIRKAQHACALVTHGDTSEIEEGLAGLLQQLRTRSDYETKLQVRERLNALLKHLDAAEMGAAWPDAEIQLKTAFDTLVETDERVGGSEISGALEDLRAKVEEVRGQKDVALAIGLADELRSLNFQLLRNQIGFWIGYIKYYDTNFDDQEWANPEAARSLISQAKRNIAQAPSRDKLEAIVFELFDLLPGKDMPLAFDGDRDLLAD